MHSELPWEVWSADRQQRIGAVLERVLADEPGRLGDAMRYATLGGGKRVRPLLAYAAGEVAGGDPANVDAPAAAVELIHAYSLVHDDLPAMDNDTLRRGEPTCHVAFGEAVALLAGDALQTRAFGLLAASRISAPAEACALLARAAGACGMAGGQGLDLAATGTVLSLNELTTMHRMKTGALIASAVQLGARSGRRLTATQATALDLFASAAGLAFQVVDDLLDVEGSAASLGKTAGKDAAANKPTFVSLLGLAEARRHALALRADAHAALAPFGAAARRLHELVDWIVTRER
ncbi:MAG: polyprenyl synthetase family protein [Betaproteobacteria bacterium]